jgi:hypothetical protein
MGAYKNYLLKIGLCPRSDPTRLSFNSVKTT